MSNMPKVSVVVPVYGVEKYIERCARSLFEQTLEDMEFVFVDDCTKDNSIAILEKVILDYPKRKDQIKIIHHEQNKGLSHARETGVKNATGDYIGHCDSDDWVEKEMYEEMYLKAMQDNCDFVKCGHKVTDGMEYEELNLVWSSNNEITNQDAISYLLQFRGWNSIWSTLVKRVFYKNIEYTSYAMLEDFFVVSQLFCKSPKIGIVNKPFYCYFINMESICHIPGLDSINRRVTQARTNLEWIIRNFRRLKVDIRKCDVVCAKWGVKNMMIPVMHEKSAFPIWKSLYPEIRWKVWRVPFISFRNKVRFYCADLCIIRFLHIVGLK